MSQVKVFLFFFIFKKKSLLPHTVNKVKVSALARLTLYENIFIGQEKSDRCPH